MLTLAILLIIAGLYFYYVAKESAPDKVSEPFKPTTNMVMQESYHQNVGDIGVHITTAIEQALPGLNPKALAHLKTEFGTIARALQMPPAHDVPNAPYMYLGMADRFRTFIKDSIATVKGQLPEYLCTPLRPGFPVITGTVPIDAGTDLQAPLTHFPSLIGKLSLEFLKSIPFEFSIDERTWLEHCALFGATGSGKTNLLSFFIDHRLNQVARGQASVMVMESNRDLVMSIARLKRFAPGGDLHGRLILIDFEDVEHTIGINPFSVPDDRNLSPSTREAMYAATIWSLEYLYKSLFAMELTPRQATLLQFASNLMLATPNANLDAMHALMQPGGIEIFRQWLPRTDKDTQSFFADHFDDKSDTLVTQTKQQMVARIFALKRISGLARMMNAGETMLDLAAELSKGKVILVNISAQHLAETGVEVIGRYFLSLLVRAMRHRALLTRDQRIPTYVFLDECHSFIASDTSIETLLDEARKYLISITLSTQRPDKLQDNVLKAIYGSAAIRFAAKLSDSAAYQVARNMGDTSPDFIKKAPKHSFACYVRDLTHTSVYYKAKESNFADQPSFPNIDHVRRAMRAAYPAAPVPVWRKPEPPPRPAPPPPRLPPHAKNGVTRPTRKSKLTTDPSEYT